MKSIMNTCKGTCYVCGRVGYTHEHHVFYGIANRRLSEKYGLKVDLCFMHHEGTPMGVHGGNQELNQRLKQEAQRAFENQHGSRDEFMKIFGKNYLEDT